MFWLDRFSFIIRSSITTLRESVEDPPRMIHQLICDMEEEQVRVRASVAEAIADEIQLKNKVDKSEQEANRWGERAKQAMSRKDEEAARAAIEQRLLAEQRHAGLAKEHEQQRLQTEKLQRSTKDLEDKIRQARQKKTLLLARMTRADSERKIRGALGRAEANSAFSAFHRLEERVERAEALCEADDRLNDKDPAAEELERQFSDAEMRETLQKELEELKRQMVGNDGA
jgi:phage shock protein A